MELLDSTEKLVEAQTQITKLQTSLDNIMKEKVLRHFMAICKGLLAFQYCLSLFLEHTHTHTSFSFISLFFMLDFLFMI